MLFFEDELSKRKQHINSHKSYTPTLSRINQLIDFMYLLSDLISCNGHCIVLNSKEKVFFMQTELLDSVVKTLSSTRVLFEHGHIGDVNVLIRKMRDDLFLYLYFLEVSNRYSINKTSKHEQNAIKWVENKIDNLYITDILQFLMRNHQIKTAIIKHQLRDSWEGISQNLNRFVHGNGRSFTNLNYSYFNQETIEKLCKDILFKLEYIIAVFMVLLILIRPSLISSSDYMDALTVGIEPEDDSQYFVAPFIQEFINETIMKVNPELKNFLKESVYMNIE